MGKEKLKAKAFMASLDKHHSGYCVLLSDALMEIDRIEAEHTIQIDNLTGVIADHIFKADKMDERLDQAMEALALAKKYGNFDPLSDQTIIRAIDAALKATP